MGLSDVIFKFQNELDLDFGNPANLAGIPTLTMPCGKEVGVMPVNRQQNWTNKGYF